MRLDKSVRTFQFGENRRLLFQAQCTFAAIRHAMVDLAYLVWMAPKEDCSLRFNQSDYHWMVEEIRKLGVNVEEDWAKLEEIRAMYEPFALSLSDGLLMDVPEWRRKVIEPDNWQYLPGTVGSIRSQMRAQPNQRV